MRKQSVTAPARLLDQPFSHAPGAVCAFVLIKSGKPWRQRPWKISGPQRAKPQRIGTSKEASMDNFAYIRQNVSTGQSAGL